MIRFWSSDTWISEELNASDLAMLSEIELAAMVRLMEGLAVSGAEPVWN